MLEGCYRFRIGRLLIWPLTRPGVSRAVGRFMDSRASALWIRPFIRKNGIDMSRYPREKYASFNAFFTRSLSPSARKIDMSRDALIAPCDGYLSVYPVSAEGVFCVKGAPYTVESLTQNPAMAGLFAGGIALVYRLTPADYHRYCYPDDGVKGENTFIPGILHTVRPYALGAYPVFKTNSREYTLLNTENGGRVLFAEVGAMLVGRIKNFHQACAFARGQEKGCFEFGGSTVIAVYEKGRAVLSENVLASARAGEYPVRMGMRIGQIL